MQNLCLSGQFRQPLAGFVRPCHRHPTDFLYAVGEDSRAERLGHELRAEANSDGFTAVLQLFPEPRFFRHEPGGRGRPGKQPDCNRDYGQ